MPSRFKRAKPPPSELVERLAKRQVESADELRRRLKRAQKAVAAKIERLSDQQAVAVSKKARDTLFRDITSIYDVTAAEIDAWLYELTEQTALEWHGQAVKDMRTLTGAKVLVKFDRDLVRRTWEIVHGGNQKYLAGVFTEQMTGSDLRHLRSAVIDTFRQQSVEGWTAAETHKALQSAWDRLAKNLRGDRFVDAAGRRWQNADYLNMLTRTTFARVQDESYVEALTQEGYSLARIVDDGEPCDVCRAWSGLILDISGNQKSRYPSRRQAIDAGWKHPRCGCRLEFVSPTLDKAEIDRQRRQTGADWNDTGAVQEYNDQIRIREKRDAGMTAREAVRDLTRDKLKRELQFAGAGFSDAIDAMPDQVLDQMHRTGIPRVVWARRGEKMNSARNSSKGGVLHLDRNATSGQFRRALYTLQARRGVRVADWRGLPAAADEDTAIGHFALFKDTVTAEEKAAILAYTRPGANAPHKRWNDALRSGDTDRLPDDEKKAIRHLDRVLEKAPRFEGTTFRGIPVKQQALWDRHEGFSSGDIDVDPGFRSSSFDRRTAKEFAEYGASRGVLQTIRGRSGVPLFKFSAITEEKEVLFPRDSAMRLALPSRKDGAILRETLEEI